MEGTDPAGPRQDPPSPTALPQEPQDADRHAVRRADRGGAGHRRSSPPTAAATSPRRGSPRSPCCRSAWPWRAWSPSAARSARPPATGRPTWSSSRRCGSASACSPARPRSTASPGCSPAAGRRGERRGGRRGRRPRRPAPPHRPRSRPAASAASRAAVVLRQRPVGLLGRRGDPQAPRHLTAASARSVRAPRPRARAPVRRWTAAARRGGCRTGATTGRAHARGSGIRDAGKRPCKVRVLGHGRRPRYAIIAVCCPPQGTPSPLRGRIVPNRPSPPSPPSARSAPSALPPPRCALSRSLRPEPVPPEDTGLGLAEEPKGCLYALSQPPLMLFLCVIAALIGLGAAWDMLFV